MKVIRVIPISRGIAKEELSYFSSKDIPEGSVVSVPLRKKLVSGIVIGKNDVRDIKSDIRKSEYKLKKIERARPAKIFLPSFISAAKEASDYFATTTGAILTLVTAKNVLDNAKKIKYTKEHKPSDDAHEPFVFQAEEKERVARYKGMIRESFAKGDSVIFLTPTITQAENFFGQLKKGIEKRSYVLHGGVPKTESIKRWVSAVKEKNPIFVVVTPPFLSIPRGDVGMLVVESEHSSSYKSRTRPFVDFRVFAEILAKHIGSKLVFGDMLLRVETLFRFKNLELIELARPKLRYLARTESQITDMKRLKPKRGEDFRILGNKLESILDNVATKKSRAFVFVARRGMAPSTACRDCGHTISCEECNSPMTLRGATGHTKGRVKNEYVCNKCGLIKDSVDRCENCKGWRLVPLGIGVERVSEAIESYREEIKVFKLDSERAGTIKKARKIVDEWVDTPSSVLVGTEMSLQYLPQVEYSAVASIDSLFSIPDFRINERVFNILLTIRSKTEKLFVMQTRTKDTGLIKNALEGNVMDFYQKEINDRKSLDYPPFTTLIKILLRGKPGSIRSVAEKIGGSFDGYKVDIFPSFTPIIKGIMHLNILITLPRGTWIDKKLLGKLRTLPPSVAVVVDPESTL